MPSYTGLVKQLPDKVLLKVSPLKNKMLSKERMAGHGTNRDLLLDECFNPMRSVEK